MNQSWYGYFNYSAYFDYLFDYSDDVESCLQVVQVPKKKALSSYRYLGRQNEYTGVGQWVGHYHD